MTEDESPAQQNPYAPPKAASSGGPNEGPRLRRLSFASERRSVATMVLLSVVTLGIYPAFWYLRRQPFFDGLGTGVALGSMPRLFVGIQFASLLGHIALAATDAPPSVGNALNGGVGAVGLILAFRAADILRKGLLRKRVLLGVSSVGVFFFGSLYLQHKINQAADAIERLPKRKKSKAAAPTEPARAEDQPDDDVGSEEAAEAGR